MGKVKCPNCKRICFETTDKYDPDKTPNGSMVRSLMRYQIDWLCSSTTTVAEMTCPECLAPLAPNGRLIVLPPETAPVSPLEVGLPGYEEASKPLETELSAGPEPGIPGSEPDQEPEKTEAGPFICPECGKEFKSKMALFGHSRKHRKSE